MKPLTEQQKKMAYRYLVHGPMRFVAQPTYAAVLKLELGMYRLINALHNPAASFSRVHNVTALIKTFERPERCRALVSSIRQFYPDLPIIVVDDSKHPTRLPNVTTRVLTYDSGVSVGRREGLSLVRTKYVINLDDDYIFCRQTNIARVIQLLDEFEEIDIIGGVPVDLPFYITHDSKNGPLYRTAHQSLKPKGSSLGGLEVCDKVSNFFVGRTEKIKLVNWDPLVKRLDHADFFTRCTGKLVSAIDPSFRILHVRNPFDYAYRRFRYDLDADLAYLGGKYAHPWR
ncbi:glycosyltransferase family 2 protein [Methylocystis sp. H62]|uniref:glycosyltransferase family A protein n=1 Tax=Methylocystis sp. H62 TaxID=2785789 RepID=UPI0018C20FA0|nr:glycosyltransferase family A protein [Methylocystis sp. H62]MBG0792064.1 glycosyltransferase family 2 protein [Methylocystis sp. H62]